MRKQKASVEGISSIGTDKEGVIAKSDGAYILWDLVEARSRLLNTHIFFIFAGINSFYKPFPTDEGNCLVKPWRTFAEQYIQSAL